MVKDDNLSITGRIKEILITSGGENVEPQAIEQAFKLVCPIVSHVVLVGDGRKFVSLLLTLKVNKDRRSGVFSHTLTAEAQNFIKTKLKLSNIRTVADVLASKEMQKFIKNCIERANLEAVSRVSRVKKWKILPNELDVMTGELTPTFKVKRNYICKKYEDVIEAMYSEPKL